MRRPVILILTAFFALVAPLAAAAHASTSGTGSSSTASMEQDFVSRVNALRASKGLAPLVVDSELTSIARQWAGQMAQAGAISHNPNLANEVKADWTKLGENVGTGPDVPSIQQAFVNSPHHYENMVDPAFTRIGVGVVVAPNGAVYTSHEFERLASDDARPAAPAPTSVRVSRPAVTRTASARPAAAAPAPVAAPAPAPAPAPVVPARIALSLEVSAGRGL